MTNEDIKDLPLAVYKARPEGQLVTAEIEGASGDAPALVVRFLVPGPVEAAQIEARSREAVLNLIQGAGGLNRYGLKAEGGLDETAMAAMSSFVSAVESAAVLIREWNLGFIGPKGEPERTRITVETISELFRGRPLARTGWTLQYESASPLERAEGNGSAASPDTTSATAANTVEAASPPAADAPAAASVEPGSSAPAP